MPTPEDTPPNPTPTPPNPTPEPGPLNWKRFIPTNWQSIVSTLAITLIAMLLGALGIKTPVPVPPIPSPVWPDGWVVTVNPDGTEAPHPTGWSAPTEEERQDALKSNGVYEWRNTEAGKVPGVDDKGNVFLWKASIKARGKVIPARNQGPVGSCMSFGSGGAYETSLDVQVASGKAQRSVDVAQEVLYAGHRVEANGGIAPLFGDGGTGAWMAKWIPSGGVVERKAYGPIDLSEYSPSRCRLWGRTGVPDELEPLAKQNTASVALVENADELLQALTNGYSVFVCSNQGFSSTRDADGFARPSGRWAHCMYFDGYRADKRGFHCRNSWGENWISGPEGPGEPPPGGFWVDWNTADRMMKARDSYAVSSVKGFPKQKLNADDWIAAGPMLKPRNKADWLPVFALAP
jgi:hypothetical protein